MWNARMMVHNEQWVRNEIQVLLGLRRVQGNEHSIPLCFNAGTCGVQ